MNKLYWLIGLLAISAFAGCGSDMTFTQDCLNHDACCDKLAILHPGGLVPYQVLCLVKPSFPLSSCTQMAAR